MSTSGREADALIEQSAQRLFGAEVDRACRDRVEAGEFDARLCKSGMTLQLARVHDRVRDLLALAGAETLVRRSSYSVDDAVRAIGGAV